MHTLDQRVASIVDREVDDPYEPDYFERWLALYQQVLFELTWRPDGDSCLDIEADSAQS